MGEKKKALVVVRTYPIPAMTGVEVSCTAAISDKGDWLRLFPVPYRFLDDDKRFRKYQWIQVEVTKASDARPESFHLQNAASIQILTEPLPTEQNWQLRKDIVVPLRSPSLCHLQREQQRNGFPTLGIFKPKAIRRLKIESEDPHWSDAQLVALRQGQMFEANARKEELEKIPWNFIYEFTCNDCQCKGHKLSCTDWELGQSYRSWRDRYGEDGWESKLRQRYEQEMIEKYETHFFVGTVHKHPNSWIIVGLFYPPLTPQVGLFGF
jgi:hypothetical protein